MCIRDSVKDRGGRLLLVQTASITGDVNLYIDGPFRKQMVKNECIIQTPYTPDKAYRYRSIGIYKVLVDGQTERNAASSADDIHVSSCCVKLWGQRWEWTSHGAVSYTHLDVYKRQTFFRH